MAKLNALSVKGEKREGRHCDDDSRGLYLQVKEVKEGVFTKSWLFRFKGNWAGLGGYPTVSLKLAREKAAEARTMLAAGIDPLAQKRRARVAEQGMITFSEAAERYITAHEKGWRNPKHRAQWRSTIKTYCDPIIGRVAVGEVDTGLVMRVLDELWQEKPETASRLRGRIEVILDWAKVRGYRDGENPARWKGHLDVLLAPKAKVKKPIGHAALDFGSIPAFMVDLRQREAVAARALEFLILCASRTSEALEARWSEIDIAGKAWTIPAERMKARKRHAIPLSDRAVEILVEMQALRREGDDIVFPGQKRGRAPSNMALLMLLRRMGHDLTAHGFRSTFRTWVSEKTNFPGELAEAALAHAIPSRVEAAYQRGDLFEKRRKLMDAWAGYCESTPADDKVIQLQKRAPRLDPA